MSKYPSNLDDDSSLPSVIDGSTEISGEVINALKAAVLAVQRAIGADPQGSLADLVARLAVSINDDGTLKSSALVVAAIVNSQVAAAAGIEESKLALDFSTQFLRDQITSNDIDIQILQSALAQLIADFSSHHLSGAFPHDSDQILLDAAYPSSTPPWLTGISGTTVADAIRELADALAAHTSPSAVAAHAASNISVTGSFSYITASNVQEALEELEALRGEELRQHLDDAHSNGISAWENDPLGWNRNLQLYPSSGTTAATVISRYVVDFGSDTLRDFKVARGEVLVFGNEAYVIAEVGPRVGTGSKPTLDSTQLELFRPLPVASGIIQAAIFGKSSVSNLKSALAAATFPGTSTADTLLLARPNAAKVVSLGLNPLFIDASCELHMQVATGAGTSKSIIVDSLHLDRTGVTPVLKVTAASIAERINYVLCSAAAGNAVPAAAYVIGSEIAIIHNWSDSADYWLEITGDTAAAARGSELCGFGSNGAGVVGFRSYPTITGRFSVNGINHQDFASYYSGAATISGSTIGIAGSVSDLGIVPGHVVHVISTATSPEIGSYQITAVGPSTVQVGVALTADPAAVIRIDASSVSLADLDGSPNAIISEIFVDRDGFTGAFMRASAQEGISGIEIVDVSDSRLAGTETLVSTSPSAGQLSLQFNGAAASNAKVIRDSLLGKVRVYDRTGMSWVDLQASGTASTGSTQLEFYDHTDEEEMFEIASVRFFDRRIRAIADKRLFGSLGLDELREDVTQAYVETPLAELRSSGVVRGFGVITDDVDATSVSPNYPMGTRMVLIDGGVAYVDGVRVEQTSQYVAIPPVNGTYFVCINVGGLFQVVAETDFSLSEIIEGFAGSLVPLLSVARTSTPAITSLSIAYNIANIDERVDAVLDLTNHFVGNFSNIQAAIAYLNAYPFEERARLRIVSRRASSSADDIIIAGLTAPASIQIDGYLRELRVSSDCAVGSDTFSGRPEPHASTLIIGTSSFTASNLILSSVTVDLAGVTGGTYVFEGCEFTQNASISVLGSSGLSSLVFKDCSSRGGTFSLQCNTTDGAIRIADCSFTATPATGSSAHGGSITVAASSCSINDSLLSGVGFTWNGSGSEFGLTVSALEITDISVTSARDGFATRSGHAAINDLRIKRSYRQSGTIVDLGQTVTSRIAGLLVDTCEVQFSTGVASILRGGGESVLDGAILSELSMPSPASTDPHIAIPNVFGFLYDGPEIISIVADNITESVGVGSVSTSGVDGIVGSSSATSLQPGISGLSITSGALPVGSGYVLSGNTISGYIGGQSLSVPSLSGFADRGLLQSHVDASGNLGASYRVRKRPDSSDPLSIGFIRIVDVSDDHPNTPSTGVFSNGYQLTYDGIALSWALGEPVTPVLGSTHRLYTSDYSGWIDVYISSTPTGSGTDLYRVLASVRNAGKLLLGYHWWDGSAVLGTPVDKRYFGNVAGSSLADSARGPENDSTADNRGTSIFSGGLVTTDPSVGLDAVRIYGPLVAYVSGRRFVVPVRFGSDTLDTGRGGYGGVTLPYANNYLYVDSAGILQIAAGWPATNHAKIAQVAVIAGVAQTPVDSRFSYLFVTSGNESGWSINASGLELDINLANKASDHAINLGTGDLTSGVTRSINIGTLSSGLGRSVVAIGSNDEGETSIWGGNDGIYLNSKTYAATDVDVAGSLFVQAEMHQSGGLFSLDGGNNASEIKTNNGTLTVATEGTGSFSAGALGTGNATFGATQGNVSVTTAGGDIEVASLGLTGGGAISIYSRALAPATPAAKTIAISSADDIRLTGDDGIVIHAGETAAPSSVDDKVVISAEGDISLVSDNIEIGSTTGLTTVNSQLTAKSFYISTFLRGVANVPLAITSANADDVVSIEHIPDPLTAGLTATSGVLSVVFELAGMPSAALSNGIVFPIPHVPPGAQIYAVHVRFRKDASARTTRIKPYILQRELGAAGTDTATVYSTSDEGSFRGSMSGTLRERISITPNVDVLEQYLGLTGPYTYFVGISIEGDSAATPLTPWQVRYYFEYIGIEYSFTKIRF